MCVRARTQAPPAVEAEAATHAPLPAVAITQVSVAAAVLAVVTQCFFILCTCCEMFVHCVRFVHAHAVCLNSVCACVVPPVALVIVCDHALRALQLPVCASPMFVFISCVIPQFETVEVPVTIPEKKRANKLCVSTFFKTCVLMRCS